MEEKELSQNEQFVNYLKNFVVSEQTSNQSYDQIKKLFEKE